MNSHNHPDFAQESNRLTSTIAYMKKIIDLIVENRQGQRAVEGGFFRLLLFSILL